MRATVPSDHTHPGGDADELIRSHGLRRTPQRQVVLGTVIALAGHATAEEIVARVRARLPSVSPSTVYRTLSTLEDVGILCHAHLGHTASVYHLAAGGLHQHLVCERCGALEEVTEALAVSFARQIERRFGFRANLTHFAVLGECRRCATRARRARPRARSARGRR